MQALSRDIGELAVINKGHGSHTSGEVAAFIFCKRTDVVQFLRILSAGQAHVFFAISSLRWPQGKETPPPCQVFLVQIETHSELLLDEIKVLER